MSDVNIPKQCVVPAVGSVVHLREYSTDMIVTDIVENGDGRPYAVSVVWLDSGAHPHHLALPLECLEEE